MKKLIILGMALSTMAFAKGNFNNDNFGGKDGQGKGTQGKEMQVSTLTEAQQKELATVRETHQKAMAPLMLSIQEKDLAIKKELLADKINWTKVESLTKEKSDIEAKMEVQMLKNQVEIKEKFGINVGGFGMGMKGNRKGMKK